MSRVTDLFLEAALWLLFLFLRASFLLVTELYCMDSLIIFMETWMTGVHLNIKTPHKIKIIWTQLVCHTICSHVDSRLCSVTIVRTACHSNNIVRNALTTLPLLGFPIKRIRSVRLFVDAAKERFRPTFCVGLVPHHRRWIEGGTIYNSPPFPWYNMSWVYMPCVVHTIRILLTTYFTGDSSQSRLVHVLMSPRITFCE